jgi:N,N'-diacetyllegionaminate synthase
MGKVFIIAEAGVNHNGQPEIARKLIDIAAEAKADAVKFQVFKAENIVSPDAPKAQYQSKTTSFGSQYEMIKKLELGMDVFADLKEYADKIGILFLASGDFESLSFLNELGLAYFKIPSGELNNIPYLRKIGSFGGKVILSTGIGEIKEIELAVNTLIKAGTSRDMITVLHCNTEYPTPFEDVNLLAMIYIKEKLKIQVGYSDHTCGIEVPVAAVALGAKIIEKHFTLNKSMTGPDHKSSLDPYELKQMVSSIRNIELALGEGIKNPSKSELKNKITVRKSIFTRVEILAGRIIKEEDLMTLRPGDGISPAYWDQVIGKKTCFSLKAFHKIKWTDIK